MERYLQNFPNIPINYLNIAVDGVKSRENKVRILLEKKKLPDRGWDDVTIEFLVNELSRMDSNNFINKCGVGEREGRIICDLVARRHYNFGHGVGRSGDLVEPQPKAIGSSIIADLTNAMLLDLIQVAGVRSSERAILVPMATGMTLVLCFLALKLHKPNARYILWSRIDQKACFKSILTAGLVPIIIEPKMSENYELITNTQGFDEKIQHIGADNILCIFSTTSCFAPRQCDDITGLSSLAKSNNIFHVVNNAYGLQSTFITHQIEQGIRSGGLDLFVQSTDKNLLVPVGGAVVAGPDKYLINSIAKAYAGRSSASQTLDVCMTLLHLGRDGYMHLIASRKQNFQYLQMEMANLAEHFGEQVLSSTSNPISIAMTLSKFEQKSCTEIGSKLFVRGVSGARVVSLLESKTIGEHLFDGWGRHSSAMTTQYLTVAAGLGISREEITVFVKKLRKVLERCKVSC